MMKHVLVTGANSGIGLALCKQLCAAHGCHVFLGARSADKGASAVEQVKKVAGAAASVELLLIDVADDASVAAAAQTVKAVLASKGEKLYAVANNAGTALQHNITPAMVVNTNLYGPRRVCDAFIPLLDPESGRIANVGSASGPMYVRNQEDEMKKILCDPSTELNQIDELAKTGLATDSEGGYGLSKALLASYTMFLARTYPNLLVSCLSPGYIDTAISAGGGGNKLSPEEGTVSLRHCLFANLPKEQSGWYYGSDAVRSPLFTTRNPGEPAFDGQLPF